MTNRLDLAEAVPPAYTAFIGAAFMAGIRREAA